MTDVVDDEYWMSYAIELGARGEALGEVPVGAVLVKDGKNIGEGWNQPITSKDPTAHAEIIAIRAAAAYEGNYRIPDSTLYVTLEPCTMCVGALIHARVERLVYGTTEPKSGSVESQNTLLQSSYFNHRVGYQGGVLADECQHQLSHFFQKRREQIKQAKLNPPADAS